jgi:hypothetical protein
MRSLALISTVLFCLRVEAQTPEIPIAPGVTFVLAVTNAQSAKDGPLQGILQGDYEMPVVISAVDEKGVTQTAFWDGVDKTANSNDRRFRGACGRKTSQARTCKSLGSTRPTRRWCRFVRHSADSYSATGISRSEDANQRWTFKYSARRTAGACSAKELAKSNARES